MKKAILILGALALAVVTAVLAQEKPATPATAAPQPATATTTTAAPADPVIITAGTVSIRKSDFETAVKSLPAEYQSYALGPGKKQFADDYLRMKLLAAEGVKNGIDKSPDVVKQLDLLKENLVAQEELKRIDSSITVTDADLKKAYEGNKKDYEQVKARHILIAFKGSPAAQKGKKELTDAEAKAKAEALRNEIVSGKAKFEDVAKKESDDAESGKNGGELGTFGRGQMVPEFEEAAFSAKVGDVTPVVKTQFGYHIIRVDEHASTPFEQVKATLEKNMKQKKLRDTLDAMKDSVKPTYDETYFAPPAKAEAPVAAPKTQTPAAEKKPVKKP
ncbi:MAG TPA: peptidylprolyl isomerase [Thermoanaerobaculia bacterium]|nr:peptidylprolyl isomerase [Thermoanaerobaculia bacterium]